MGGVEVASGQLGILELVVPSFAEADREGVDALAREARHEPDHCAAIGAAAQESPRVLRVRAAERLADGLFGVPDQRRRGGGARDRPLRVPHVPIALHAEPAVLPFEEMAWWQPPDGAVDRLRGRDRAVIEVGIDRFGIHHRCRPRQRQRNARSGPERDARWCRRIVESPDAEAVDGQHEAAGAWPPERHGKAPAESCKKPGTVATIAVLEEADRWPELRGAAKFLQVGQV
jgi:hypothetical protein